MIILRYLLFPISLLYGLISLIRNYFFENRWFLKSSDVKINTICVGNLTVGGTGKTPQVEFLIESLKDELNIAVLSRGYGRKTKGFIVADHASNAEKIGDEPYQIYKKFNKDIAVSVGEDRVISANKILALMPDKQLLILVDAFQHRYINVDCNILLTDYKRLFFEDFMLPTGNLREVRSGAKRANIIVVTKCDEKISKDEQIKIQRCIKKYNNTASVYYSYVSYGKCFMVNNLNENTHYISVSGIAQNKMFHKYCKIKYNVVESFSFRDHKRYSKDDFLSIVNFCKENKATMLVTEKDYVKLLEPKLEELLSEISWGYVPIKVNFVSDQKIKFINEVKGYIK